MTNKQYVKTLHSNAQKAIRIAVSKALHQHEEAGVPAMIWKDGKVVAVKAKGKKKSH